MNDYEVLGFHSIVNIDEVKKRFRKLAKEYHPDLNNAPEAVVRFRAINDAYNNILSNKISSYTFTPPPPKPKEPRKPHNNVIFRVLDDKKKNNELSVKYPEPIIETGTRIFFMRNNQEFSILFEYDCILPATLNINSPVGFLTIRVTEGF